MNNQKILLLISVQTGLALAASGAVLVGFDMNEFSGTDTLSGPDYALPTTATELVSSFTDPGLETVALSVGPDFTPNNQSGFYRFAYSGATNPATSNDVSGAYMEFTLDPVAGNNFSLDATDSIQIYSRSYDTDDISGSIFLRSSLDGYSSTIAVHPTGGAADAQTRTFDVGNGFVDLASAVTFRVYLFDTDGDPGGFAVRNNGSLGDSGELDFVINGSIGVVPEPSTYALILGFAAIGFAVLRRRR